MNFQFKIFLFLNNLISIISHGQKFIPCLHYNFDDLFNYFLNFFDENFKYINRSIILNNKNKKMNLSSIELKISFKFLLK